MIEELEPEPVEVPEPETPPEPAVASGTLCKVEGCGNSYVSGRGPYARLCETHAAEAKAARKSKAGRKARLTRQTAPKRLSIGRLVQNWIAARDDLEHAAVEIRERTGSEPEEFIAEIRSINIP